MSSTEHRVTGRGERHEHTYDGQTLRHSHAGGRTAHGYFEHPEDAGLPHYHSESGPSGCSRCELARQLERAAFACQWTPASAVWQIRHGDAGTRTDSASEYLAGLIETTGNTEELRGLAADLMVALEVTRQVLRELRIRTVSALAKSEASTAPQPVPRS